MNTKTTPSFFSSSFIILVLTQIINLIMGVMDIIPQQYAAYAGLGACALYMLSRGIGKIGAQYDSKGKRFYQTSEFYVMLIGIASTVVSGLADLIPPKVFAALVPALAGVYQITRSMSKIGDPVGDFSGMNQGQILALIKNGAAQAVDLSAARKAGMIILIFLSVGLFTGCPKDDPKPSPEPYDPTNGVIIETPTETEFVPPSTQPETGDKAEPTALEVI